MSGNYYGQPMPNPHQPPTSYADPYLQAPAQPQWPPVGPQESSLVPADQYAQPNARIQGHPAALSGSGYGSPPGQAPYLVRIGSMVVTETEVHTPAGSIPLDQAVFTFADQTYTTRKTPTWAVLAAIIGFFILTFFSLFFLLAKENQTSGQVVIGVYGGNGVTWSEAAYVHDLMQVQDFASRINYANQLSARWQR